MEEGLERDGKEASKGSFDLLEAFAILELPLVIAAQGNARGFFYPR